MRFGTRIVIKLASVLTTATLAACGIVNESQTPRPISPITEGLGGTPIDVLLTATASATATETKTATQTPEIAKIDAFDMSTWTPEMVEYYSKVGNDPTENAKLPLTDAEFHKQFVNGMRFGLLQRGITEIDVDGRIVQTKEANEDGLYFGYIREAAKNQQESYISKEYLIKIKSDSRLEDIPFWTAENPDTKKVLAIYGLWKEWINNAFVDPVAKNESILAELLEYSAKTNTYGSLSEIPYFTSQKTYSDFAGFIRLPGALEDYAVLSRIKNQAGHSFFKINSIAIKDPIKFDSGNTCFGAPGGFHEIPCTKYSVATKGIDFPNTYTTAKLWTKEEWLFRLSENFNFMYARTPLVPITGSPGVIMGYINPNNGLEMLEEVSLSSTFSSSSYQNNWPDPTN